MVYTVDGTVPDVNSDIYTDSLRFTDNTSLKIATLLPSGKTGRVREIEIVREALSPASDASTEPGVVSRTARGLFIDTVAMKDAEWSEPQIVDGFMKAGWKASTTRIRVSLSTKAFSRCRSMAFIPYSPINICCT